MASKIIFDHPVLLEESLIDLAEATKCFPIKISRASLERYIRRGKRGTQLETVLLANKRLTSREAVARFVRNQLQTEPEKAEPQIVRKSKKEIDEAAKRFGLAVLQD